MAWLDLLGGADLRQSEIEPGSMHGLGVIGHRPSYFVEGNRRVFSKRSSISSKEPRVQGPANDAGVLATTCLALVGSHSDAQVQQPTAPPIRQVDHIMIRTGDPGELYTFFTEILRLPVAWPMATRWGVTSGGVGFGTLTSKQFKSLGRRHHNRNSSGSDSSPRPYVNVWHRWIAGDQLWCTTSGLLQRAERINPDTLYKCHSAAVFRHGGLRTPRYTSF
jgi:hypothetical protein